MHRPKHAIAFILVTVLAAACGAAAPSAAQPTDAPSPRAATFEEYSTALCGAFDAMFQGVGNPDTGSGSALSKALDQAVEARDVATAERLALTITTTLEAARQEAAVAGRWPSAASMAVQLDRVLLAFEAMIAAKKTKATGAAADPQATFEAAGGVDAWTAMFRAYPAVVRPSGSPNQQCPTVPLTP
jgi:hypothetical protein